MKTALLALAVVLGLPDDKEDPAKKDIARLQGEWVVSAAYKDGKKLSEEERRKLSKYFLTKVVVNDDKVILWLSEDSAEPREGDPIPLRVLADKKPKVIYFGETLGIFSVEGDTLKVCVDQDFSKMEEDLPASFDTAKNSKWYLFEFKRTKK